MDYVHPISAVIPGAQGRILDVLVQTTAELSVRTIARLAGVSAAQASRVLPDLVELGIHDGVTVEKELRRPLPLKTKTEYEPDDVAPSVATKAVERALRCVGIARSVAAGAR